MVPLYVRIRYSAFMCTRMRALTFQNSWDCMGATVGKALYSTLIRALALYSTRIRALTFQNFWEHAWWHQ